MAFVQITERNFGNAIVEVKEVQLRISRFKDYILATPSDHSKQIENQLDTMNRHLSLALSLLTGPQEE